MVDYQNEILGHYQCLTMERVLDALEELYEATDGQDSRFSHGLVEVKVKTENSPHCVTDGVGQEHALRGRGEEGRGGGGGGYKVNFMYRKLYPPPPPLHACHTPLSPG